MNNRKVVIAQFEQHNVGKWSAPLEKHVYNHTIDCATERSITKSWANDQFITLYSSFVYSIICNLPKIIEKLDNGELAINEVCTTSILKIDPDAYKDELKVLTLRLEQKVEERYSTRYKCPKCHEAKIKVEERQTSALDEIAKFFKICANPACGFKWT